MQSLLLAVSADSEIYQRLANYFSRSDFGKSALRNVLFALLKLVVKIVDGCSSLLGQTYKLTKFVSSSQVQNFLSTMKPVLIALLVISLTIFGWQMVLQQNQDRSKVLSGIVLSAVVLLGMASLMSTGLNYSTSAAKHILTESGTDADSIVQQNVVDLLYLDKNGFTLSKNGVNTSIPKGSIMEIDINEKVYGSNEGVENSDVFKHYVVTDGSGNVSLKDIDDGGITNLNDDVYYRFSVDWTTVFITLIAMAIVFLFSAFKVVKIIYDLIVHQILGAVMAATDWSNAQKIKEVIKGIIGLLFTLFITAFGFKIYTLFSAYCSSQITNGFTRAIILFFAALAVIDGPNIIERVLGVDAGLSGVFRSVSSMYFASRGVSAAAHSAGHAAGKVAHGAANLGGGIAGAVKGGISGFKESSGNIAQSGEGGLHGGSSDTSNENGGNSSSSPTKENDTSKGNLNNNSSQNGNGINENKSNGSSNSNNLGSDETTNNEGGLNSSSSTSDAAAQNLGADSSNGQSGSNDNSNGINQGINHSDAKSNLNDSNTNSLHNNSSNSSRFSARNKNNLAGNAVRGFERGENIGNKIGKSLGEKRNKRNLDK